MTNFACDLCGRPVPLGDEPRYVVRIQVFAAADPMELTADDLKRDLRAELRDLVRRMENLDPEKAQDQVHREFTFELCPACHAEYLKDPLRCGIRP